jgi:putative endonuclease
MSRTPQKLTGAAVNRTVITRRTERHITEYNPALNYTYILRCNDGTYYTGWTNDPAKRLAAHNSGIGGKYTRARRPLEMVYCEQFETKQEAQRREYAVKQLTRKEKERLIAGEPPPAL